MKPIFCTDTTHDKHSTSIHGEEFVFSTVSETTKKEINASVNKAAESLKKAELPTFLQALRFAGLCAAVVSLISMFDGGQLRIAYLLLCIASVGAYIGISVYENKRKKAFLQSESADVLAAAMEEATRRVDAELEIPPTAVAADVICFRYKEKDGKREVVKAMQGAQYLNVEICLYKNDTHLFIADMERVFAFPLQGMKGITAVREPITLFQWNKPCPPSEYGLTHTNRGIPTEVHYILEFTAGNEDYGIYFPCYELEAVKQLTGLDEGE